ncbi:unnamed protein product, partial [Rotaria sp. Silwood2]
MSVVPFGYQRESTLISSTGDAALAYSRKETTKIGDIRATGITVTVPENYAGKYNFAVEQYNNLPVEEKTMMRGGRFLLRRYILIAFWLLSMIFGGVSAAVKPLNDSILHPKLMVLYNDLGSNNEWYVVPIHTRIEDRAVLAAVGGDNSAAMAAIREEYSNMKEIKMMAYTGKYVSRYTYFPANSIILHIVGFLVSFVFGIALAAA